MTHLLIEGIYWSLHDSSLENPAQYPPHLQPLIASQDLIGWDQIFLGRFSLYWTKLHSDHLTQRGYQHTGQNSGTQWLASLIRLLWTHIHQVWLARNLARHGSTFSEQLEKQRQACVSEISLYYDYYNHNHLSPDFPDHIFYPTLQEHLHKESTLQELDNWLCNYRDIILAHKQPDRPQNPTQNRPLSHHSSPGGLNSSSREGAIT